MHQMMGALFYRKIPVSDIKKMDYMEMCYWYKWHKVFEDANVKAAAKMNKKDK